MEDSLFKNPRKALKQIAEHWGISFIYAQALAIVVFPVIEVLLAQPQANATWYVWVIVVFFHLIIGLYSIIGSIKFNDYLKLADIDKLEQTINELTKKNKEDEEEIRLYLGKFKEHFRRQIALQASLVILNHLLHEHKTEPSVSDLEKLISPLIKDRSETLGFRNEEYYNFVVYILDKTDKELKVFYRSCDDRIQRTDRSWSIGVGHVGIAFANNQTIIKSDSAGNPEYKSKHSKETDDKYYASFISSPIFNGYNTEKDEIGIFEITSSRPGHFEDDDKIIVDSYSFLLSLYFSGCGRNGVTHE